MFVGRSTFGQEFEKTMVISVLGRPKEFHHMKGRPKASKTEWPYDTKEQPKNNPTKDSKAFPFQRATCIILSWHSMEVLSSLWCNRNKRS
ncbi:unnamed protein product [Caretta caretta]